MGEDDKSGGYYVVDGAVGMHLMTVGYALGLRAGFYSSLLGVSRQGVGPALEKDEAADLATSWVFQALQDEEAMAQVRGMLAACGERMQEGVSVSDLLMAYAEGRFDDVG